MMSGLAASNGRPPRRGAPPRAVVGVVADESTRALLSDALAQRGIQCSLTIGGIDAALSRFGAEVTADCAVVDLDRISDGVDDIAVLVSSLPDHTDLIVLGRFSPEEEEELKQAGATYCLSKPLHETALFRVFDKLDETRSPALNGPDSPSINSPSIANATGQSLDSLVTLPQPGQYRSQVAPQLDPRQRVASELEQVSTTSPSSGTAYLSASITREPRSNPDVEPLAISPALDIGTYANGENAAYHALLQPSSMYAAAEHQAASFPSQSAVSSQQTAMAKGRVISVVSCRGGVGATTITVGLAWLMAEEMGHRTALLDLDPFYGSIALALNLDPGEGLHQALETPTRIDAVFLDRAMRKVGRNLLVLSNEQSLVRPTKPKPGASAILIQTLARNFERVIVDLPRGDPETMAQALSQSDEVLLVTDLSLAGARDTTRLMMLVRSATPYARIRIVGGGARDNGKLPILSPSEFRRAVGTAIEATITHDAETATDAARSGRPVPKMSPRSAASKAMRNLIRSLEVKSNASEPRRRLLWWKR